MAQAMKRKKKVAQTEPVSTSHSIDQMINGLSHKNETIQAEMRQSHARITTLNGFVTEWSSRLALANSALASTEDAAARREFGFLAENAHKHLNVMRKSGEQEIQRYESLAEDNRNITKVLLELQAFAREYELEESFNRTAHTLEGGHSRDSNDVNSQRSREIRQLIHTAEALMEIKGKVSE